MVKGVDWHRLTNLNLEARTADCSRCGPTRISIKRRQTRCIETKRAEAERRRARGVRGQLRESQGGKCALCGEVAKLVLDHDHTTLRIRGMICTRCNVRIGRWGDNLEGAISHLRKAEDAVVYAKAVVAYMKE